MSVFLGEEKHEDGSKHFHALVFWEKRRNMKDPRWADITYAGKVYHPNIAPAPNSNKSLIKVWRYVTKEGNWQGDMTEPPTIQSASAAWEQVISAETRDEAVSLMQEHLPRDYVMGYSNVTRYLSDRYAPPPISIPTMNFSDEKLPQELITWRESNLKRNRFRDGRPKSLILIGPSRLGKTEWGRSLGSHSHHEGNFDFAQIQSYHEYALFNDVNPEGLLWYKNLVGGNPIVTVTDKYVRKRTLEWGNPTIWTLNQLPEAIRNDPWIIANCDVIDIVDKLY